MVAWNQTPKTEDGRALLSQETFFAVMFMF
jgi:hypothetical protein